VVATRLPCVEGGGSKDWQTASICRHVAEEPLRQAGSAGVHAALGFCCPGLGASVRGRHCPRTVAAGPPLPASHRSMRRSGCVGEAPQWAGSASVQAVLHLSADAALSLAPRAPRLPPSPARGGGPLHVAIAVPGPWLRGLCFPSSPLSLS